MLEARAGRPIAISAVSARNRDKDRGVPLGDYAWEDDPVKLATRADVDVFVELMGGADGPAKAATEAALAAGKDVVTANKAIWASSTQRAVGSHLSRIPRIEIPSFWRAGCSLMKFFRGNGACTESA